MSPSTHIDHPVLVQLHEYWRSLFHGDRFPSRGDIDPVAMGALLQWVFLIDVTHDPITFRYRLIGTGITRFLGRDYTGRMIDEAVYGERAEKMRSIFMSALDQRNVTAVRGRLFYVPAKNYLGFCWTMMPLSTDGRTIDMLLCGYVPSDPSVRPEEPVDVDADDVEIIRNPVFPAKANPKY